MNFRALRADHTGSLMRPSQLQTAFERHRAGQIDAAALQRAQDAAIPEVIAEQERHGLPFVTDGELRRTGYMDSFRQVRGWEWGEQLFQSRTGGPKPARGRLELVENAPLEEYQFAARSATKPVKLALVNIDHLRGGVDLAASQPVYPDMAAFERDVLSISRQMIAGLVDAGCRYIQIDGPSYAFRFIDPQAVGRLRNQGQDPAAALQHAIDMDIALIEGFDDVTFGMISAPRAAGRQSAVRLSARWVQPGGLSGPARRRRAVAQARRGPGGGQHRVGVARSGVIPRA